MTAGARRIIQWRRLLSTKLNSLQVKRLAPAADSAPEAKKRKMKENEEETVDGRPAVAASPAQPQPASVEQLLGSFTSMLMNRMQPQQPFQRDTFNRVQMLPDPKGVPLLCNSSWGSAELRWAGLDVSKDNPLRCAEEACRSMFEELRGALMGANFLSTVSENTGGDQNAMVYLMSDGRWAYVGFTTILKAIWTATRAQGATRRR